HKRGASGDGGFDQVAELREDRCESVQEDRVIVT
ncbi:MAG: hypothetical protein QOH52_763, partial [Pseudonocardiales bacterium]|nr:hypothetical protein [Pseudonocardiales bacterium]